MCRETLGHCWHSNLNGTWGGIYSPPEVCCFCGINKEDTHGPYNPQRRQQLPYQQWPANPWQDHFTNSQSGAANLPNTPGIGINYQTQHLNNQSQQDYFGIASSGSLEENPGGIGGRASEEALH